MKTKKTNPANHFWLIISVLLAVSAGGAGCTVLKPTPDPLAGWQVDFNEQPNQTIVNDYQNYIQQLPPQERKVATVDTWQADGMGQHAIKITVGLNGINWRHILVYDKNYKRVKTIKYASGDSHS